MYTNPTNVYGLLTEKQEKTGKEKRAEKGENTKPYRMRKNPTKLDF